MNEYDNICKCECECHIDEMRVRHIVSCCGLCYEKYMNSDGQLDRFRFAKLMKKVKERYNENN